MSGQTDTRTPEEIERDIERTRADFSSTVEALQQKLKPSELADQAREYVMATPPVASTMNAVNSVRANPIPYAMIGIGIAWLMTSNRHSKQYAHYPRQRVYHRAVYPPSADIGYESTYDSAHTNSTHANSTHANSVHTNSAPIHSEHTTEERSDGLLRRASSTVSQTGRGLREKASAVGGRISDTASSISDRASEVGQRISGSASDMTDRAKQMTRSATVRLQETAEEAQARLSQVGYRSQEQYYRAKNQASQLVDEQPLVVGALGIALGAALGAVIPTTRRENELLGPTRDELMLRARETTREHAETVKQSAQRIAELAKEEIGHVVEVAKEEAGVIADAAKEEARLARDKMSR